MQPLAERGTLVSTSRLKNYILLACAACTLIVLGIAVSWIALGISRRNSAKPTASSHIDFHDPMKFQETCGEPAWRKTTTRADGMPNALSLFYATQSFQVGQTGIMVMFRHTKSDDPLGVDYSDVTFFSVPSDRILEWSLALKMLGCAN